MTVPAYQEAAQQAAHQASEILTPKMRKGESLENCANRLQFQRAYAVARKICGCGSCYSPFECDHKNHKEPSRRYDETERCPLSGYHIDTSEAMAHRFDDVVISKQSVLYVCDLCQHALVSFTGGRTTVFRKDKRFCEKCPVKQVEDIIDVDIQDALQEYMERIGVHA